MFYELPQLPYANDALAPVISEKTYIENLNRLIKGTEFEDMELEDVIVQADGPVYNNASQAWNHIFYFFSFSPDGGGEPDGELGEAIKTQYGSFEEFQSEFENAGVKVFGSGWVWLSRDNNGLLHITSGGNAYNPLTEGLTPILTFDVWEHAYYLDYQNRRAEALHRLWEIIDWDIVGSRY